MKSSDILKIRKSKIFLNNIKEDIKILSVGDFHINKFTKEDSINFYVENAYKNHPDYICLLGDILDNPFDINEHLVFKLIRDSSNIAPTFIIKGNHDFLTKDEIVINKELWTDIKNIDNVKILDDKLYQNDEIIFMGYTQKKEAYYNNNREQISDSDVFYEDIIKHTKLFDIDSNLPKVALIHSPEYLIEDRVQEILKKYDLIICGHYHNGCVPPMLDKIWNSDRGVINARRYLFPKNVRGIQKLKYNYLIYNGGWIKLSRSTAKKFSCLDSLFNRQMDLTILTGDPEYMDIEIKEKYKIKLKNKEKI